MIKPNSGFPAIATIGVGSAGFAPGDIVLMAPPDQPTKVFAYRLLKAVGRSK
ncbi:MAG TPA: hypothetical protein VKP66_03000 [Steroidobacteraceae bacterium]|nr:hypothetical protein [Steroidobacteraceae bacterium]